MLLKTTSKIVFPSDRERTKKKSKKLKEELRKIEGRSSKMLKEELWKIEGRSLSQEPWQGRVAQGSFGWCLEYQQKGKNKNNPTCGRCLVVVKVLF